MKNPASMNLSASVAVEFQVIETVQDTLSFGPNTEGKSIGYWLDTLIGDHVKDRIQLGKITLDLADLSKTHIAAMGPRS